MTPDQVALLKRTICKDATDDELKLFMHVAQRTGLDPFARQIYAVKRKNNKTGEWQMVIQTSIDGFRLAASRSGAYAGSDDPVLDSEETPNKATVTVYKMVQGQRCAFTASARWKEYYPGNQSGSFMWDKMPCVMLSKVAEALALRKAFPADLSGVYAAEEMDQAGPVNPHAAKNMQPSNDGGDGEVSSEYEFQYRENPKLPSQWTSFSKLGYDKVKAMVDKTDAVVDGGKKLTPNQEETHARAIEWLGRFENEAADAMRSG